MRASKFITAQVSALAFLLVLAGCESGGLNSAPTPTPSPSPSPSPSPTPTPASYTKIEDLQGDHTFRTASITVSPTQGVTPTTQQFGTGLAISYTEASDSYTVTAPGGGSSATFTQADLQPAQPNSGINAAVFVKKDQSGQPQDILALVAPAVNGVTLSYTRVGQWTHFDSGRPTTYLAVGGVPTLTSDMPRNGTANYDVALGGTASQSGIIYNVGGNGTTASSTASFSANFLNGTVSTSMTLGGYATVNGQIPTGTGVTQLGTYSGTGTIASGGPGFSGTLSGNNVNGAFVGAFFGPQALEMGYNWYLNNSVLNGLGTAVGIKSSH